MATSLLPSLCVQKSRKVKGTAKIWVSPSIVKKEEVWKQIFQEFQKFSLYNANVKKYSGENYTKQTSVLRFPKNDIYY
jgi:hypothetical protein